jgi:hypothetical protein
LKNHLNPTIADKGFISRPSPRIIATSVVTDRCEQNRKFDQTLSILRERNARQYAIDSVKGVDEATYVRLGGIDQWVTIRGEDRQNPVLLFVHGGPGDVTNPWSFALFAAWEKRFTVVQWDQRGAGRTLRGTGPSIESAMILDRMAQDGIELSEISAEASRQGKDRSRRPLLWLDPWPTNGAGQTRPFLRLRGHRPGLR